MRFLFLSLVLMFCGCNAPSRRSSLSTQNQKQLTILDACLKESKYTNLIIQAERNLPLDQWEEQPWRHNDTREWRLNAAASKILEDLRPRFKQMTVTELVKSLKVHLYLEPLDSDITGIGYYIYQNGNLMIIQEIRSRPKPELQVLPLLADDQVEVFGGAQGSDTLTDVINSILGQ